MTTEIWVSLIGGLASIIVSVVGVVMAWIKLNNDRKNEAIKIEADERTQFRQELRDEIARLRDIIEEQDNKIKELMIDIEKLKEEKDKLRREIEECEKERKELKEIFN